jgi:prephenate dehydratase
VEGNINDPNVEKGLKELEGKTVYMKILGSYPKQSGDSK